MRLQALSTCKLQKPMPFLQRKSALSQAGEENGSGRMEWDVVRCSNPASAG